MVDPNGDRTIAIITKPDLIDKGAESTVLQLLLNETKRLKLGYHMVKGRGQSELSSGVTLSEALITERLFFQNTLPWSSVSHSLLGIGSLRAKLVLLLEVTIRETLPSVRAEISDQKEKTIAEILRLGVPLDCMENKRSHFRRVLDRFFRLISDSIKGVLLI